MDLQTRKLNFIQDFLKLESEKVIAQFERLMKKSNTDGDLKPMSIKEFQKRIDTSTDDSENERLTENNKLISEIDKWS